MKSNRNLFFILTLSLTLQAISSSSNQAELQLIAKKLSKDLDLVVMSVGALSSTY